MLGLLFGNIAGSTQIPKNLDCHSHLGDMRTFTRLVFLVLVITIAVNGFVAPGSRCMAARRTGVPSVLSPRAPLVVRTKALHMAKQWPFQSSMTIAVKKVKRAIQFPIRHPMVSVLLMALVPQIRAIPQALFWAIADKLDKAYDAGLMSRDSFHLFSFAVALALGWMLFLKIDAPRPKRDWRPMGSSKPYINGMEVVAPIREPSPVRQEDSFIDVGEPEPEPEPVAAPEHTAAEHSVPVHTAPVPHHESKSIHHTHTVVTELDRDKEMRSAEHHAVHARAPEVVKVDEREVFVPPLATLVEMPPSTHTASPAAVTEPSPAPVAPKPKKAGLLSKLFGKDENGRPADLKTALRVSDGSGPYRLLVAALLRRHLPAHVSESLVEHLDHSTEQLDSLDDRTALGELVKAYGLAGLSTQQAAEAFAEVTNAIMVLLVDAAAETVADDDEEETVAGLNVIADFVDNVGQYFVAVVPGATVAPIVYNGRSMRGTLETLYTRYAKQAMGENSLMKSLTSFVGSEDHDSDLKRKEERVGKLQVILDISETRRGVIEKKLQRDMLMTAGKNMFSSMAGGQDKGMGGLLGNMLNPQAGKGAGRSPFGASGGMPAMPGMQGMPDFENIDFSMEGINKLMEQAREAGFDPSKLPNMKGLPGMNGMPGMPNFPPELMESMPDLENMSPESMEALLDEHLQMVSLLFDVLIHLLTNVMTCCR